MDSSYERQKTAGREKAHMGHQHQKEPRSSGIEQDEYIIFHKNPRRLRSQRSVHDLLGFHRNRRSCHIIEKREETKEVNDLVLQDSTTPRMKR